MENSRPENAENLDFSRLMFWYNRKVTEGRVEKQRAK